jgi:Family of unknown function (DUF6361)
MNSSFSWLDYSEQERRQALDVISAFNEHDTRDELGLGSVRDAFAEIMFPGTSTIQTRAKYFLFIPWIYLGLEHHLVPSNEISNRARHDEIKLIDALCKGEETEGVIGIEARSNLKRLPSNVYWQGLAVWGIRTYPGSQSQYHRSLNTFYQGGRRTVLNDDGEPVEGHMTHNWHSGIPAVEEDFLHQTDFNLARKHAQYLQERIMARAPGTLLSFLVQDGRDSGEVDFAWEHPQYNEFPPNCREQLEHARNFSEAILGAQLLYNLLLAQKSQHSELIERYTIDLEEWFSGLISRRDPLSHWDRDQFWKVTMSKGARVAVPTRVFIDTWLDIALNAESAHSVIEDRSAQNLIARRESTLKGKLSRLENPRSLEIWSGAAGTAQLDYRWRVTQNIVKDILAGLAGDN